MAKSRPRCDWPGQDPDYIRYHDKEWGVPLHDDRGLFEMLVLESFQAGLSWLTILKKREHFRSAFSNWDIGRVASYGREDVSRLMSDKGIVRNRRKIESAISNARAVLDVQKKHGSFDGFIWSFTNGHVIRPEARADHFEDMPVMSDISEKMSRCLKKEGFRFVGPVICYSFMQAVGMIEEHQAHCFLAGKKRRARRVV